MLSKNNNKRSGYPKDMGEATETTQFLRLPQIVKLLGIGRVSVYDKIKKGLIKKPIKLGSRTSVWLRSDIDEYIARMVATRDGEKHEN
ncbi:MAG: AlpA family transcriptional regulator [Holosporales bacterium]|jgi:predicted DNA-binding transcriptional regulator AlpA|nr:AlpA family transcriptional regulator [Holosporales bacterium]